MYWNVTTICGPLEENNELKASTAMGNIFFSNTSAFMIMIIGRKKIIYCDSLQQVSTPW